MSTYRVDYYGKQNAQGPRLVTRLFKSKKAADYSARHNVGIGWVAATDPASGQRNRVRVASAKVVIAARRKNAGDSLRLQGVLQSGQRVRVKDGVYAGSIGIVRERLTTSAEPTFITGAARYAISMPDGRTLDYARHEIAKVSRRKARNPPAAARFSMKANCGCGPKKNHHLTVGQAIVTADGEAGTVLEAIPPDVYRVRLTGSGQEATVEGATLKKANGRKVAAPTVASILAAIRALGLKVTRTDGEYRVAYRGLSEKKEESSAYYTTDGSDALGTARYMASRRGA